MTEEGTQPLTDPASTTPVEDARLVAEVLDGVDEAFSVLVERYKGPIYAQAWSGLKSAADAEDATADTFSLAYRRLDDLRSGASFGPWLRRIGYSIVAKALGRRRIERNRLGRLEESAEWVRATENPTTDHPSPLLKQAMGNLTPEDRAVITLFYLLDMDQKQIAADLNIPVGTVKSRLTRARRQLERSIIAMSKNTANSGPVGIENEDYGRNIIAGNRGVIHWRKLLESSGLDGWTIRPTGSTAFTREGEALVGACPDKDQSAALFAGQADWANYELSILLTPIRGGNAQVFFRISDDARRYYLFDMLLGWQALAISEVDRDRPNPVRKLSVVNFPIELGREYDVMIAVREASLTCYVDGKLANQVTDFTHSRGPIALNVWQSKTAYRDVRIRLMQ